ncbi:F10K1.18 protein, putative isoform 6 [Hibiscus syriacus]|uniref:F10K1.18 protein, putative isoform 6 n=1 Tax=Hibiscus syriacus TaxID=106335 RepID=A0A6A3C3Y9_HIBSY|nr:F10K1.18 protein, putative isoform 6 [Hibiscus syriacus]
MPLGDDESVLRQPISLLKKQLEASLSINDSLVKENQDLKQEVARLKAHISSLKAHDNERRSLLWKKLHNSKEDINSDASLQKSPDFVESQNVCPRPSFQELAVRKERQLEAPKPPPRSHNPFISSSPKEVNENKAKAPLVPAPPATPLPSKLLAGSRSVRRVPEVGELYRSLTRKDANIENKSNMTATPLLAFTKNMIGEIENRSTYVSAIKSDVEKQKEFINFLISEVQSAAFKDISDVEVFVKSLDQELSSLVDERAVLKHFPHWPERKADALREAAFSYRDLKNMEAEVSSFKANPKESFNSEFKRMQALQDRRACIN